MKLYNKILILTITQLLAIFIFGIYQIQTLYLTQQKAFDHKTLIQTEMVQTRFEEMLQNLQKSAKILMNSQEVTTGIISNDTDLLFNWGKLFLSSPSDKIHFMNLKGTVISRGEAEYSFGDDVSKTFYFQQVLHNDTFLGIDIIDNQECLVFASRIKQYGKKPIGIICVAIAIDQALLNKMVEGTNMSITYHSAYQDISTTHSQKLFNISTLHVSLQTLGVQEATFHIGLTSEEELSALKETRTNFLLSIALAFVLLFIALHIVLLKHLKDYENLTHLLIDFYEDHISIKEVITRTQKVIFDHTAPEVKKIAEALFKMSQKIADTQDELEALSTTDQLTSLANRRKLEECLNQKLKEANRGVHFSIIMLDIDRFKTINDTYGHEIGDHVLLHLSHTMYHAMRVSDIVGRWGGEEFLLILPETSLQGAIVLAEGLCAKIAELHFEHYPQSVTISLGVATYHEDDTSNTILNRADTALYKAKNSGRNRVEYED
ncbi:putative diguanylate-cyclase [Sulfurospirillum diekertiae]|uniref:diguanylate cyclase n=1 Tax=Sulfurospirillum diekertiae TaxID=1854492 RepID=A0A290HQN1_9BACT|nr:GGDEF domain-containing protein [Sulfurospirillum diekertiae]ATB70018.1 putative diguanylate-cyclase [Sulfurospirillum diekertiae]